MIAAFVDRIPHSCMSYEDNLSRFALKFAKHSPVLYDQIYIDGQPIGHPMMKLVRIRIGGLQLENLPIGKFRILNYKEAQKALGNSRI